MDTSTELYDFLPDGAHSSYGKLVDRDDHTWY